MTDQQTILITGATDGPGRALAQRPAAAGHVVLLHDRDQQKLDVRTVSLQLTGLAG
jgi:short-subunit dehydrogenase